MKRIAVLGSSGSIGTAVLDVIRRSPDRFRVAALSVNSNTGILSAQASEFKPDMVCINDESLAASWKPGRGPRPELFRGMPGLREMVKDRRIDMVVMAISGSKALLPLLDAIDSGKEVATANKEALVIAGDLVRLRASRRKVRLIPIDSEQSAIWQCLEGQDRSKLKKIYLTASGGPFRNYSAGQLKNITVRQALDHPRWKMGRKITIDSATLMNKGLEVLEAMALFGAGADDIEVVVHPESIIHSMVEFVDGVVMAQLSVTDMRIPIQYAMSYPERLSGGLKPLDFARLKSLNFAAPDPERFPCLGLAYRAARCRGTMPAVLNAANEESVGAFLERKIDFVSIPAITGKVMARHNSRKDPTLSDIAAADAWAREEARGYIDRRKKAC